MANAPTKPTTPVKKKAQAASSMFCNFHNPYLYRCFNSYYSSLYWVMQVTYEGGDVEKGARH